MIVRSQDINLRDELENRFTGPIPAHLRAGKDDEYLRRLGYVLTNLDMADTYAAASRKPDLALGRRNDLHACSEWHRQEADRAAEWFLPAQETAHQMAAQ